MVPWSYAMGGAGAGSGGLACVASWITCQLGRESTIERQVLGPRLADLTVCTSRLGRARCIPCSGRGPRWTGRSRSGPADRAGRAYLDHRGVSSVEHFLVFLVGSVENSIFWRARCLPPHRHAGPVAGGYTFICEVALRKMYILQF